MNDVALPSKTKAPALTLKGNLFTLTVIYLNTSELGAIESHLRALVQKTPKFFQHAPVVVDYSQLPRDVDNRCPLDFHALKHTLIDFKLVLVGIRSHQPEIDQRVLAAGLALLPSSRSKSEDSYGYRVKQAQRREQAQADAATSEHPASATQAASPAAEDSETDTTVDATPTAATTKIITAPVRSGQQVYAKNADLIVLSSVSHGAEVLADGNIHIYGSLSGRALAGVQGNTNCHIFCRRLDAELIAIAGNYRVKEDIFLDNQDETIATMLDIYLQDGKLCIRSIN